MPLTAAENCSVCPALKAAVAGLTVTATGAGRDRVTMAAENLVGSMTDAALMVISVVTVIEPGAVYSPDGVSVPVGGIRVHVTPGLFVPVTATPNCCDSPARKLAASGVAVTEMGIKATAATAVLVASASEVAVTRTVSAAGTIAGAV